MVNEIRVRISMTYPCCMEDFYLYEVAVMFINTNIKGVLHENVLCDLLILVKFVDNLRNCIGSELRV